ncbi:hypothetical protein ACFVRR_17625 [Gottfriedia sp. NPDC057948]|uniref:sunset domain-containing protein n=1 Tax=Gottfriedia sp. NPDC057948 TaxID=3346287 RepID=UPI0036DC7403
MSNSRKILIIGVVLIIGYYTFHYFHMKQISGNCSNPQIKGNTTTYNGEKIYHEPGDQFYTRTNAEVMFCTEEDAEKAGFRRSLR